MPPGGAWCPQAARHVGGWRVFENSSLSPRPQSRDGPGGVVSAAVTDPPPLEGAGGEGGVQRGRARWSLPAPPVGGDEGRHPACPRSLLHLSVPGGASGPSVVLRPVTLCSPVAPCSLSPRHLREELQLLLQLSERWHLRPRDGDLPLPAWCRRGPLRGRWVPLERTGAPPLSSTPSVRLPSPRAGRRGHRGGTEFQVCCFFWGLCGGRW